MDGLSLFTPKALKIVLCNFSQRFLEAFQQSLTKHEEVDPSDLIVKNFYGFSKLYIGTQNYERIKKNKCTPT